MFSFKKYFALLALQWCFYGIFAQQEMPKLHDPSTIVKAHNQYYLYTTGMGISGFRSSDKIHWQALPPIFKPNQHPAWIDSTVKGFKGHFWAPDLIYMNGLYHVYYSCSTFGAATSAIGLVTSPTLDPQAPNYQWTDHGIILQSKEKKDFNAIDPSILKDKNGKIYMTYGSFHGGIAGLELDSLTGKQKAHTSLIHLAGGRESDWEASCLIQEGKYYYLFVNNGLCCKGINSTYYIVVGRSENPLGPFLDKEGKDLKLGGGTVLLRSKGRFLGPGHLGLLRENHSLTTSIHYYDAQDEGKSKLGFVQLTFKKGWPIATIVE